MFSTSNGPNCINILLFLFNILVKVNNNFTTANTKIHGKSNGIWMSFLIYKESGTMKSPLLLSFTLCLIKEKKWERERKTFLLCGENGSRKSAPSNWIKEKEHVPVFGRIQREGSVKPREEWKKDMLYGNRVRGFV